MTEIGKRPAIPAHLQLAVAKEVQKWQHWVTKWTPGTQRTRAHVCRKCIGSPIVQAAGFSSDTPHQVTHALVARMHKLIDREVDAFTAQFLPLLARKLEEDKLWSKPGFDPRAGIAVEHTGLDVDPLPDTPEQPFLFTLEELTGEGAQEDILPRPPLTPEEKAQLRAEIERADQAAMGAGQAVCLTLAGYREAVVQTVERFVEPQIQALLDELAKSLM